MFQAARAMGTHMAIDGAEARSLYPQWGRATVLRCYFTGCTEEAVQICNHCGEVYCSEHSTIQRDARSTVVFGLCSLCASANSEQSRRAPILSIGAFLVVLSWLLLWYLDSAIVGPLFR